MDDDEAPLHALEAIVVGAVAVTARALQASGADLTLVQWRLLVVLASREEPQSVGMVAAGVGATSSATSRLAGRLVGRGLVNRQRDPDDGRSSLLSLTPRGADLVALVLAHRQAWLRHLVLTADERAALPGLAAAFRGVA